MGGFTACSLCNANSKSSPQVTFHRATTTTKRKKWLKALKDAEVKVKHRSSLVVCSLHFDPSSYVTENEKQTLLMFALPIIFASEKIFGLERTRQLLEVVPEEDNIQMSIDDESVENDVIK